MRESPEPFSIRTPVPSLRANFSTLRTPRRVVPWRRRAGGEALQQHLGEEVVRGLERRGDQALASAARRRSASGGFAGASREVRAADAALHAHADVAAACAFSARAATSSGALAEWPLDEAGVVGEARQRPELTGGVHAGGRHPAAAVEDRSRRRGCPGHPLDPGLADGRGQAAERGERQAVAAREARAWPAPDRRRRPGPGSRRTVSPSTRRRGAGRRSSSGCRRAEAVEHRRGREQLRVRGEDAAAPARPS